MEEFEELSDKLEEIGEQEVRERLAHGSFGERKKPLVEEWLRSLDAARISASSSERSEREERALEIAEEANSIAREANNKYSRALAISEKDLAAACSRALWAKWAKWAAILATRIATSAIILSIIMTAYEIMKYFQII